MKKTLAVLASLLLSNAVFAHSITVKMSLVPASSFEAKSDKLKGEVKKEGNKYTAENLWVKVDDLKTEIDLRDEHFHKHLHADTSPKITFTKVTAADGKGSGTLTVNGIPKVVAFTYKEVSPKKLEATMKVKPSEFKLESAKYMGVGVEDEVEITAFIDV
jgi:polyisoprenoid-binding protein YceI